CLHLDGILEKFSTGILHEAKLTLLVCTTEVPNRRLPHEKLRFLRGLELGDRVKILLNRAQRHTLIPIAEVEKLLQLPVYMSFPNDYVGVHKAIATGKHVNPASALGEGFRARAESIRSGSKPPQPVKPGFMELLRSRKKPAAEPGVLAS